ncbi:MAG: hypothetical protein C4542_05505 [Dehalococcoidia bacterium]|nr:MAG: hypothetical protein C4542_05505 [Dehalococcoidia bacterium]
MIITLASVVLLVFFVSFPILLFLCDYPVLSDPRQFIPGGTERLYIRPLQKNKTCDYPASSGGNRGKGGASAREKFLFFGFWLKIVRVFEQPSFNNNLFYRWKAQESFYDRGKFFIQILASVIEFIVYKTGKKSEMNAPPAFPVVEGETGSANSYRVPNVNSADETNHCGRDGQALQKGEVLQEKDQGKQSADSVNKDTDEKSAGSIYQTCEQKTSNKRDCVIQGGSDHTVPAVLWVWSRNAPAVKPRVVFQESCAVIFVCAAWLFLLCYGLPLLFKRPENIYVAYYTFLLFVRSLSMIVVIQMFSIIFGFSWQKAVAKISRRWPAWYASQLKKSEGGCFCNKDKTFGSSLSGYLIIPNRFLYFSGRLFTLILPVLGVTLVYAWVLLHYSILEKVLIFLLILGLLPLLPLWVAKEQMWNEEQNAGEAYWLHQLIPRWSFSWKDEIGEGSLMYLQNKEKK